MLAGTPLGRPADASGRLAELLGAADVVAAEDTRRTRRLAADLGVAIGGRLVSFFDAVEAARVDQLVAAAAQGATVLVVSDAGMPLVSDPGYRLVVAAVAAGIEVTCAPGPSAVTAALAVSGLPADRFCFEGFLPRKTGDRRRRLAELATEPRTMVFFESPRRTAVTLADLAEAFGDDRAAALCRELTKTYEEVRRGALAELAAGAHRVDVLGEVTLVVAGADAGPSSATPADLVGAYEDELAAGTPRREAMRRVAERLGVHRRDVYDAVLAAKQVPQPPA
ncbi:MAG: hypothetical protein RLZ55_2 [Actinomycetota bacterium]